VRLSLIHSFLFLLFAASALSQPLGNEWIDYSEKHLKIPVWEDGVNSLNFQDLSQAFSGIGENLSSIPLDELSLFHQGQEVPLFIKGDLDNVLESGEEICFLAKANDGSFDSSLYVSAEQLHNFHSMFNDTSYYFLRRKPGAKRYSSISPINPTGSFNYIWYRQIQLYTNGYQYGARNFFGSTDPEYRAGEGYFDGSTSIGSFGYLQNRQKTVFNRNLYTSPGAPDAELNSYIIPVIGSTHSVELRYGSPLQVGQKIDWLGSAPQSFSLSIPVSNLGGSQTPFRYFSLATNPPPSNNTARYAISHFDLRYPRNLNLSSFSYLKFELDFIGDTTSLSFTNALAGTYYLISEGSEMMQSAVSSSGNLSFNLAPNTADSYVLFHENAIEPKSIIEAAGNTGLFTDFASQASDSAFLLITHNSLLSSVNQFASYKTSKDHNTMVIDVHELYDQYAYGIKQHPLAIKNFCRELLIEAPSEPSYLFLVGKAISSHLNRYNRTNYGNNLVPTFGYPSCDNLFTTRIGGSLFDPVIPTGRLSARNNQDVLDYLEKVREFDQAVDTLSPKAEEQLWKKRILHFAGGTSQAEQSLFERYLSDYENIALDSVFAGNVFSFYKNSAAAIQTEISDSVKLLIDDGVALMTFFGHGAGGQLGFSIGDPETYDNEGKYPFMIANSCNVGNIYLEDIGSRSLNENFILAKQRGVIGFIASVENGYAYNLDEYTKAFYRNFARSNYGLSIAELMQQTVKDIQRDVPIVKWTCLEMNLHGDPSLPIYPAKSPEISVDASAISFKPAKLSVDLSSFTLSAELSNLGRASSQTFLVRLYHQSDAGLDTVYTKYIAGINLSKQVEFNIQMDKALMPGVNNFRLEVDLPENSVPEQFDFDNNIVEIESLISSDELIPIYPAKFAIVPDSSISLVGYTSEINAPRREYIFQIDTTDAFNSPSLQEKLILAEGGIARWIPQLDYLPDSAVYFWRCSPNNFYAKDMKWRERSFQYIEGKSGRGQAKFEQFKGNEFVFLDYQKDIRRTEYKPVSRTLTVKNRGNPSLGAQFQELYDILFRLDGVIQGQGVCGARRSMHIAVIDPISLECWDGNSIQLGHFNQAGGCANFLPKQFMFDVEANDDLDSMVSLLNKHIPSGYYILAFSGMYPRFQDSNLWSNSHFEAFENLGADSIRFASSDAPYIFFCQKGMPSSAREVLGKDPKDVILFETNLDSRSSFGNQRPESFDDLDSIEVFSGKIIREATDSLLVELFNDNQAISVNAFESWYIDTLSLNSVGRIHMDYRYEDTLQRTAAQLKYWHLIGPETPEIAINPLLGKALPSGYFEEGDSLEIELGVENVSKVNMSAYYLNISISNDLESKNLIYEIQEELPAGKSQMLSLNIASLNLSGAYQLSVELNPKDSNWVKELEHFNNLLSSEIFIRNDGLNPLLDVTFNERYISEGQAIAQQSTIQFEIFDNNPNLLHRDSLHLIASIENSDGIIDSLHYSNDELVIISQDNSSTGLRQLIQHQGNFKPDSYKLRANAFDIKGNASGLAYEVDFVVQDSSAIYSMGAFPNPFRSNTVISLDIWGLEIPSSLSLEIFDTQGKVMKRYELSENSNLRIGENRLEVKWDGTSFDGEQLSSGTYFYRISSEQELIINGTSSFVGKLILSK